MRKINRKKNIEGTTIPGFIRNIQYHFVNVDIYEDGMINCWELVDFKGLKEKLRTNWLVPQIPNGENLSIFHLGCYKIQSAKWAFDKRSYYKFIVKAVKKLNPPMANIYKISSYEKDLLEKRGIKYSPTANDFYVKSEFGYQTIDGKGFIIFLKEKNQNYLVNIIIYEDGKVVCYNGDSEMVYNIKSIKELFENGTFFTHIETPIKVNIACLGEVTLVDELYSTDISEKYKELLDIYKSLIGEENAIEKCRRAYCEYLENPAEITREQLRKLYELVPKHERIYLGDMDTRDSDYQRILFTPNIKREV